ncbi:CtrA inhibitor SciP [Ruegeria meonggei]|uniref:CtrA inhibitor SciP n=1 Tax=Ruegeria meonggei TaxID=1446476 RepID=UPI0036710D4F
MYLHKVEGPRSVTLPDGTVLSHADLPPDDTNRWVASRKIIVVRGVLYGLFSMSDAKKRYGLSDEEFNSWVSAVAEHGTDALKVTALKKYRQPKDESE